MDATSPFINRVFEIVGELTGVCLLILSTIYFIFEALVRLVLKPSKKPLTDQKVLITGAGRGLGKALALEFSKRGATVILWDIKQTEVDETTAQILKEGGKATAYICDVSLRDDVMKISEQVSQDHGCIDILVNNAGTMITARPITLTNHEAIRRTIDVNLMGHFWTIQAFLPQMLEKQKGHIVAISSLAGRQGYENVMSYCASKFGLVGLMESLKEELRITSQKNIHVTTVYPGAMNTPLFQSFTTIIKRPWLFPVVEPEVAAITIINGIQRNATSVFVPSFTEFGDYAFRILPRKAVEAIKDFFGTGICEKDSN